LKCLFQIPPILEYAKTLTDRGINQDRKTEDEIPENLTLFPGRLYMPIF